MAKQIEGVYEAILSCAKKEFLEKGYKDASLRVIAQEAGTSTGSIYTRFGDKEGLFEAIVSPAAEQLTEMFLEIQENFHNLNEDTQQAEMGSYTSDSQLGMLDFIYDHFDEFCLLLDCAQGTRFRKRRSRCLSTWRQATPWCAPKDAARKSSNTTWKRNASSAAQCSKRLTS